jgi:hypothetical protein
MDVRWAARATVVLLAVAGASALSGEEAPPDPRSIAAGIEESLELSPGHYVAAIVEVASPPRCIDPDDDMSCVSDVRLVRVFASKGVPARAATVTIVGMGPPRSRALGFFIPLPDTPEVYGATFLTDEIDRTVDAFVQALEITGLVAPAGPRT